MIASLSLVGAFLRRDWAIARSYRVNFALEVIDAFASLVLFFYLARIVDESEIAAATQLSEGYFAFAVIGLAVMRMMNTGLTSFANELREYQTTGTLEAVLATPASPSLVVVGSASYDLLSAALSGLLLVGLGAAFFGLQLTVGLSSLLVLLIAIPASFCLFAGLGIAIAAFTVVFKQMASLMSFATTGLAVLAGVYFPISVLPAALESLAKALPFTWSLDILRAALLGGNVSTSQLLLLICFSLIAVPLSLGLFRTAVNHAKRGGTLAQY